MVLYRKYRPQKLSELIGQEHIKTALSSAFESGRISHAYLFAGPRGVGKTTLARILAKAVNCTANRPTTNTKSKKKYDVSRSALDIERFVEPCNQCDSCVAITSGTHMDLIEIDAASNRGIDDIRDLREKIKLAPTTSPYKVYIVDEVHMLTTEAFNALLKTLEEPPSHAIFVLATTAYEKIPATILSRCVQFYFKKATIEQISQAIDSITSAEKISIDPAALFEIAKAADGSFRDGLTIIDALSAKNQKITIDDAAQILAHSQAVLAYNIVEFLEKGQAKEAILLINNITSEGKDVTKLANQIIETLRAMLFIKTDVLEFVKDDFSQDLFRQIEKQASSWPIDDINTALKLFTEANQQAKISPIVQLPYELAIISFCQNTIVDGSSEAILKDKQKEDPELVNSKIHNTPKSQPKLPSNTHNEKQDLSEIKSSWGKILAEVKKRSAAVEAMLRISVPAQLNDNTLVLEVPFKFHKERLESQSVYNLITQVLNKILSQKVKYKCILTKKKSSNRPSISQSPSSTLNQPEDDLEAAVAEIFTS